MRYSGIIICLLALACKPSQPVATATYSEDLSVHRPKLDERVASVDTSMIKEAYVPLENHLKAELDSIVRISISQNKKGKRIDGFAIQLYTGNSRNQAYAIRNRFYEFFPELEPKISYSQPNFRVKAGRFTNRLKAIRVFEDIKQEFPKALLVPERFVISYE